MIMMMDTVMINSYITVKLNCGYGPDDGHIHIDNNDIVQYPVTVRNWYVA